MPHETMMLFLFVWGGAFLCGIVNVLKSHVLKDLGVHEDVVVVGMMLGAATVSFTGEFLWNGLLPMKREFWMPFAVTAILNVFMVYWTTRAMKLEDVSVVISLASVMPLFVIMMSRFLLHEWPSPLGRVGIGCIALGSYLLTLRGAPGLTEMACPKDSYELAR